MVSAYERNSGRGPTDEQLSLLKEKERERFTRCSISISRRLLLRQIASRDENVNITKNRNKLFFQVYFNERVEENGNVEGRKEQFITGRIGGVTVIR